MQATTGTVTTIHNLVYVLHSNAWKIVTIKYFAIVFIWFKSLVTLQNNTQNTLILTVLLLSWSNLSFTVIEFIYQHVLCFCNSSNVAVLWYNFCFNKSSLKYKIRFVNRTNLKYFKPKTELHFFMYVSVFT